MSSKPPSGILGAITNTLGVTQPVGNQDSSLNSFEQQLQANANNPEGVATQQYIKDANNASNMINRNIASTRGLTPEQAAYMQKGTGAQTQHTIAANAGVMGLQEKQMNQSMLGNLLMGRNASDLATQQSQQNNLARSVSGAFSALTGGGAGSTAEGAAAASGQYTNPALVSSYGFGG